MIYLGDSPIGVSTPGIVGNFTKYEKKVLTFPNAANSNSWANGAIVPCSFKPKVVIFYGGTDVNNNIIEGVVVFHETDSYTSGGFGSMNSRNGANGNIARSGIYVLKDSANHGTGTATGCHYYENTVWIARGSSNYYWSNTDQYTFEIYG